MAEMDQLPVHEQDEKSKKKNRAVIYVVLIIALVLMDGYLYLKNQHWHQQVTSEKQTINSDSSRIADLNTRYHMEMDSLMSYKGQNATLDSLLNIKINQLAKMEKSLAAAQRAKKLDDTQYQKNIADLNAMVSDMKNQIADLQKQNGILVSKNDSLGKSLTVSAGNNQQLTQQNTTLNTKLTKASLLVPVNVLGEAIKVSLSGKESNTSNTKKAKRIKVAFDVPANDNIDAGSKTLYLVLADPKGTVLADPAQGSGVFALADSSGQQQYSVSKTIAFDQKKQHVEVEWNNINGFEKGDYTVKIFQDGYLTGQSAIKLK